MDAWTADKTVPARPLKEQDVLPFINRDLLPILRTLKAENREFTFVSVTADYTASHWQCVLFDATAGTFTVTLPAASASRSKVILVKSADSDTTTVTVDTVSGNIDGQASTTVYGNYGAKAFISDGTEWKVIWWTPGKGTRLLSRLIWEPDNDDYNPSNILFRPLDTTYSPVACWQFTRGYPNAPLDVSGNGYNLSVEAGTERYTWMHPGVQGLLFDGATSWYVSAFQAALALTGDMTVLMVLVVEENPAATTRYLISHGKTGETSDTNLLYSLSQNFTLAAPYVCTYLHEHGAGVNDSADAGTAWAYPNVITMFGFTRTSGVIQHYSQGYVWGSASAVLTAPTDGSNGRLRIGAFDGSGYFKGLMATAAIYNRALTAAEILERYNYCMGPAFGQKP